MFRRRGCVRAVSVHQRRVFLAVPLVASRHTQVICRGRRRINSMVHHIFVEPKIATQRAGDARTVRLTTSYSERRSADLSVPLRRPPPSIRLLQTSHVEKHVPNCPVSHAASRTRLPAERPFATTFRSFGWTVDNRRTATRPRPFRWRHSTSNPPAGRPSVQKRSLLGVAAKEEARPEPGIEPGTSPNVELEVNSLRANHTTRPSGLLCLLLLGRFLAFI